MGTTNETEKWAWPAADWVCLDCMCRSFARIAERQADGHYRPGSKIRCVNCKAVWQQPEPIPALVELARLDAETTERGSWFLFDCELTDEPIRSARIRCADGYDVVSGITLPDAAFVVGAIRYVRALLDGRRKLCPVVTLVPAGWKLVPEEPTEDQLEAGEEARRAHTDVYLDGSEVERGSVPAVYEAMLEASPLPLQREEADRE